MSIRVYICPWVGTGTKADPYRSKAVDLLPAATAIKTLLPSKADGTPASAWVLSGIAAQDFTAIQNDTTCDDLFGGDLPSTVTSWASLLSLLRATTVSQVPAARITAIQAVFDKYGIPRGDFTGSSTMWLVFRRAFTWLWQTDDNYSAAFLS